MEGEVRNFVKVWLSVFVSLCYCYATSKAVSKGPTRLLFLLPVVCLFLFFPLKTFTLHLGGMTAFFIVWLANFKLLLFAFRRGPLSSDPSVSLGRFVAVACFPIKIQQNPSQTVIKKPENSQEEEANSQSTQQSHQNGLNREMSKQSQKSPLNYVMKGLSLAMLVRVYDYSEYMHPKVLLVLYAFHIYFLLQLILDRAAALTRAFLGLELEPQFNEPYLSTSLQDFWGRRWNLMVTSILRPTVYEPTLISFTCVVARKRARLTAIMATFVVSALMHELIFYYLGRAMPTWEITCFFLLHGLCLIMETVLKKSLKGKFQLPKLISRTLTVSFVMVTSFWLFFPQFLRCRAEARMHEEYAALGNFLKNISHVFIP
ncbi:hypothetical protein FNV43_RR20120 [Rhamnella rubrinervis]|uniref:Wax synthase domain-containing protein n=1 Tax=Rhamnella rubrinervis TaxID=2594499 RepID=A0A8K0GQ59_9ROSA|nr:hypothetical protein FNV43_RR20120 [Rhamnella rubrinervis]